MHARSAAHGPDVPVVDTNPCTMPIELHHERGDTYRLDVRGQLGMAEYARCEAEMASTLTRAGTLKLLCVLEDFEGWEPKWTLNSLGFTAQHADSITRIAIVGDERWRDESLMFAAAGLRRAPVEFFLHDELSRAREWLASDAAAPDHTHWQR